MGNGCGYHLRKAWAIIALLMICFSFIFPLISATDNPVTLADDTALVDSTERAYVGSRSPETDTLTISEAAIRSLVAGRPASDTFKQSDVLSHQAGKPLLNAFLIADSLSRAFVGSRSVADTLRVTDVLGHRVGKMLADVVSLTDALARNVFYGGGGGGGGGGGTTGITTTTTSSSTTGPLPLSTMQNQWNPLSFVPTWGWIVIIIILALGSVVILLTPTMIQTYRKRT